MNKLFNHIKSHKGWYSFVVIVVLLVVGVLSYIRPPSFDDLTAELAGGTREILPRAACGNGVLEIGEQCDDGNTDNTDACLNTCVNASCGDGFVQSGVEECDDGNLIDGDGCSSTCEVFYY